MRYIIDSRYYRGYTVAIMHDNVHNDNDKEETLETLRIRHKNPNLIAITPERLRILNKRYQESIVTPFQEITEERYMTLFNCLLPLRMNQYSFLWKSRITMTFIHSVLQQTEGFIVVNAPSD